MRKIVTCPECKGSGKNRDRSYWDWLFSRAHLCPYCEGVGMMKLAPLPPPPPKPYWIQRRIIRLEDVPRRES